MSTRRGVSCVTAIWYLRDTGMFKMVQTPFSPLFALFMDVNHSLVA